MEEANGWKRNDERRDVNGVNFVELRSKAGCDRIKQLPRSRYPSLTRLLTRIRSLNAVHLLDSEH
jgi:hypothetical protein